MYTWAGTPSAPPGVPAELASHFLLDSDKAEITAPAADKLVWCCAGSEVSYIPFSAVW